MCHKDKHVKSGNIQIKAYPSVFWTAFDRKIFHTVYSSKKDTTVLALPIHKSLVIL